MKLSKILDAIKNFCDTDNLTAIFIIISIGAIIFSPIIYAIAHKVKWGPYVIYPVVFLVLFYIAHLSNKKK